MEKDRYQKVLEALAEQRDKPFGACQIITAKKLVKDGIFPDAGAALTFMNEVLLLDPDFKDSLEDKAANRWTAMTPETKKSFNNDFEMYLSYLKALATGVATAPRHGGIVQGKPS